ncbi:MAG: hypothetical protein HYU70_00845 [Bacteroidetes bacterium]|nr:hypothetical protein [Bacteroidota bacterium]
MRRTILITGLILLLLSACRKIAETTELNTEHYLENRTRDFIYKIIEMAHAEQKERLSMTLALVDFSTIERRQFDDKVDILIASISDTDVESFVPGANIKNAIKTNEAGANSKLGRVTRAVFYIKDEKVMEGNIIEISSANYSTEQIESHFQEIIRAKRKDFSGNINVNFLDRRPCNNFTIKNGLSVSSRVLKSRTGRGNPNSGLALNAVYCIDWYWVTRYFWADGSVTQTEQYVGTTCGDNIAPNEAGGGYSTPIDSLCAQAKKLANDAGFGNAIGDLQSRLADSVENGYRMTRNNVTGTFNYSFVAGTKAGVNPLTDYAGTMDGFIHNHTNGLELTFTLTDLRALYYIYDNGRMNNPSAFTLAVLLPNSRIQILRISDVSAFASFGVANLTNSTFSSFQARVGYRFSTSNTYEQETNAFLAAMQGGGLTLYEADANSLSSGAWRLEPPDNTLIAIKRIYCTN